MLRRKVFTPSNGVASSYANNVRAAINNERDPPPRAAKRKAQETLGVVREDDAGEDENQVKANAPKRKKAVEKDPKPGYCENCRDKFDDFDEVSTPSMLYHTLTDHV